MARREATVQNSENHVQTPDVSFGLEQEIISLSSTKKKLDEAVSKKKDELVTLEESKSKLEKEIEGLKGIVDVNEAFVKSSQTEVDGIKEKIHAANEEVVKIREIGKSTQAFHEKKVEEAQSAKAELEKTMELRRGAIVTLDGQIKAKRDILNNSYQEADANLADKNKELETIVRAIKNAEADLAKRKEEASKVVSLEGELKALTTGIEEKRALSDTLDVQLQSLSGEITKKNRMIEELDNTLAEKNSALQIIDELLDFRTRKKEVEEAKKLVDGA